ncbi:hypothetical protein BLNAU_3297 [Blattamonas nauphoetae]|uniref:Uncharacterized protein n=1 Tax=Blattamonas nauphoetae TaxID=2049346 RepID=A0ABQ9YDR9_9EUKA|nr:hypothetical protein BLNAU_3297 [Blattamonas nauphoetae]
MTSSEKYSPFLKWIPDYQITVDSVAPPFVSLVSMVRDGYKFDQELHRKVSILISAITRKINRQTVDDLLEAIGQDSTDSAAVILSTPYLRDLSVMDDQDILKIILAIIDSGVQLASDNNL